MFYKNKIAMLFLNKFYKKIIKRKEIYKNKLNVSLINHIRELSGESETSFFVRG